MVKYKIRYSGKYGKDGLGNSQPIVYCPECGYERKVSKTYVDYVHEKGAFTVKEYYKSKKIDCPECGCQFEAIENILFKLRLWTISGLIGLIFVIGFILLAIFCNKIECKILTCISAAAAVIAAAYVLIVSMTISEGYNG